MIWEYHFKPEKKTLDRCNKKGVDTIATAVGTSAEQKVKTFGIFLTFLANLGPSESGEVAVAHYFLTFFL